MTESTPYTPPKVWTWDKENGGKFASINRPVSGPTHDKALPVGKHPLQLYSLATSNGVKVTIMLKSCSKKATRARSTTPGRSRSATATSSARASSA